MRKLILAGSLAAMLAAIAVGPVIYQRLFTCLKLPLQPESQRMMLRSGP